MEGLCISNHSFYKVAIDEKRIRLQFFVVLFASGSAGSAQALSFEPHRAQRSVLQVDRQGTFSSVESDGLDEGLPRRTARWDVDDDVDEPREMMTPEERPKTAKELRKEQLEDQKRDVQDKYNGQEKVYPWPMPFQTRHYDPENDRNAVGLCKKALDRLKLKKKRIVHDWEYEKCEDRRMGDVPWFHSDNNVALYCALGGLFFCVCCCPVVMWAWNTQRQSDEARREAKLRQALAARGLPPAAAQAVPGEHAHYRAVRA